MTLLWGRLLTMEWWMWPAFIVAAWIGYCFLMLIINGLIDCWRAYGFKLVFAAAGAYGIWCLLRDSGIFNT